MNVKEESEKIALKLNIQKTKTMASGPITSWQIDGETVETVADCIFLFFIFTLFYFTVLYGLCRAHHEKYWTGRNTSWNQDCQEKYQ